MSDKPLHKLNPTSSKLDRPLGRRVDRAGFFDGARGTDKKASGVSKDATKGLGVKPQVKRLK